VDSRAGRPSDGQWQPGPVGAMVESAPSNERRQAGVGTVVDGQRAAGAWGGTEPSGGGAEAGQAAWGQTGDGDGDDGSGCGSRAWAWRGERRQRQIEKKIQNVEGVLCGTQGEKV
jgi:hypothetical protein